MGAWGPELDANDTAQDVRDEFARQITTLKKGSANIKPLFREVARQYGSDSDALLGLAWFLFERHITLGPVKSLLRRHLTREMSEKRLRKWSKPEGRKHVLQAFRNALDGKPFSRARPKTENRFPKRKPARVGKRWGYRDSKGRLVIRPQFDFADEFEKGVARVRLGFKPQPVRYGLIDIEGRFVLKPCYEEMDVFFHGLAKVEMRGKVGYINRQGQEIVAPAWDEGSPFEEGVALVRKGKKWGLLSLTGKPLLKPEWDYIDEYSTKSVTGQKNGKYFEITFDAAHP